MDLFSPLIEEMRKAVPFSFTSLNSLKSCFYAAVVIAGSYNSFYFISHISLHLLVVFIGAQNVIVIVLGMYGAAGNNIKANDYDFHY
jgi:hypothetical protein